jgi:hypothetical protein
VIGEALARLDGVRGGSAAVWELLERTECRILELGDQDRPRLRELTSGGKGVSLAQASLVLVAERHGIDAVLTLDPVIAAWRKGRRRLFPGARSAAMNPAVSKRRGR